MSRQIERCIPTPYVLHKKQMVSDVCDHGFIEYFYPKNQIRLESLEFEIEGNSEHLIVPGGIYLKSAAEMVLTASSVAAEGEETKGKLERDKTFHARAGVVNNIFHSLFESVEVKISEENVTKIDRNQPYRAYMSILCNYGAAEHKTYFRLGGWSKDTAGYMENADEENMGWIKRQQMFSGPGRTFEGIGKLMSPIFFQAKVIPTQTSMRIKLEKKSANFYIMSNEKQASFDLILKEAVLMVQKVSVVPGLRQSYIDLLQDGKPIPYFLNTPYATHYAIEKGSTQFVKDNLFSGRLPTKVVLAMVTTDAYHGNSSKNPFNFQHFGLIEVCLYKDGAPYPRPPIKIDVSKGKTSEAYHYFMWSLNAAYTRTVPDISLDEYLDGYFMISYNMSPDQLGSTHPSTLMNASSNLRLELKFKDPLPENITLLVYHELPHLMELLKDRQVTVEY